MLILPELDANAPASDPAEPGKGAQSDLGKSTDLQSLKTIEEAGCVGLVFRSEPFREGENSKAPTAHIVLHFSLNDEDGNIMVTPKAQSIEALGRAIDAVKKELDGTFEQARQRFAMDARQRR